MSFRSCPTTRGSVIRPILPGSLGRPPRWANSLGIKGEPGERIKIWPIVQLSDWGEAVPVSQVNEVLDHGTRPPATGVMVFVWGTLHPQWNKVEAMREFYRRSGRMLDGTWRIALHLQFPAVGSK